VNLSALGKFTSTDLDCMESFKSIMQLGTDQLKAFIDLLDKEGKNLDEYSIYYYTKQLNNGPLKLFVSAYTVNEDGTTKKYWKLTPDTIGLIGNTNRSQINIPIVSFLTELTNIDTLTVSKMPPFIVDNIKQSVLLTNSIFTLGYESTLRFDTNGATRLQLEVAGNYNKTPHGSYVVSDTETLSTFSQLAAPIQTKVKEFIGEEDYRMYLAKRGYNLFVSSNVTTNTKVERKLDYTQTNLDTGKPETKSVVIVTDLTGNTFDSDKAREGKLVIEYVGENVKLNLHTVEGQLGSTSKIKSEPITKA
jgi:phage antirepressor YoqD-like protein